MTDRRPMDSPSPNARISPKLRSRYHWLRAVRLEKDGASRDRIDLELELAVLYEVRARAGAV